MKRKRNQFECRNFEELQEAFDGIKSVVAGDTRFMAQALLFIAHRIVEMGAKPERKKRPPTAWQKALADGMRAGKPIAQIASEYRQKKLKAVA